tara:strand:+ start:19219 stop:20151 length:933 start_codon:yes stop_codon:yes gene_type:complete
MGSLSILVSLSLSIVVIFSVQKYFLSNNLIDKVNSRSSHISTATRSGGVSIFLTIFFISVYFYLIGYEIFNFSLLIPLALLVLVGLYDDINNIDFKLKFVFQIIAAKIIIDNGLIIENLHGFLGIFELNRVLAQTLTIFIIVAIINSINFIDGIDGLAISITLLFIVSFEFFALATTPYLNLSKILAPSLVPLYYFNFRNNNKVFLGDSGSLFLGGLISIYVIQILTNNYIIKEEFDLHKIIFIISILFYPIMDLIRIFFLRIMKGNSPFKPDKNHIHHIINNKIKSHYKSVSLIITLSIFVLIFIQVIF